MSFKPASRPSCSNLAALQPSDSRSSQHIFVSTGFSMRPPRSVHIFSTRRAVACVAFRRPPWPLESVPNVTSTATRAAAVTTPACRSPPPIDFRTHLPCLIRLLEPTTMLPIGAPRPLEKHRLMVSKHAQKSAREPAPLATTSQRRAPSQCMRMPFARANAEMRWTSWSGMIMPLSEFSRLMTLVGQAWTSSLRTAFFCTSSRVRYRPLLGRIAVRRAPHRDATLPAHSVST